MAQLLVAEVARFADAPMSGRVIAELLVTEEDTHVLAIAQPENGLQPLVGTEPRPILLDELAPPLPVVPVFRPSVVVEHVPHVSVSWNRSHVCFR